MNTSSIEAKSEYEESKIKQQEKIIFTKLRILKNLVILSVGSLLSYCAYDGLQILQSTINRKEGIGVISVSIQYLLGCIAALLFTKYFLKKFGYKSVITITSFSYALFIAVNFYPSWFLMIPASIFVGLASSLFWGAQSAYLNDMSVLYTGYLLQCEMEELPENGDHIKGKYSYEKEYKQNQINPTSTQYEKFYKENHITQLREVDHIPLPKNETRDPHSNYSNKKEPENKMPGEEYGMPSYNRESTSNIRNLVIIHEVPHNVAKTKSEILESTTAWMFGLHGLIFQTCHIWSNLLSYYLLQNKSFNSNYIKNSTCMCGAAFCNIETDCFVHNLQEPGDDQKSILLGTFVALSMLSVLMSVLFLDQLEKKEEAMLITLEVLLASFRHMKNTFQILLIPLTVQIGIALGFFMGDYTKAFIGCSWGVQNIGLVTAFWGASLAVSCTLSGWFVRHLGRIPIFLIGEVSILVAVFLLLTVYPDTERPFTFFIISGLFGVTLGIFWSQLRAFYGIIFKDNEEVAFGNYQIFYSLGSFMAFGYSNYLCTSMKIYILLAFSIIGFIGYLLTERKHSKILSTK